LRNLAGKEVSLMKATAWDLLNIPVDEAIDLFDNLLRYIKSQGTGNLTTVMASEVQQNSAPSPIPVLLQSFLYLVFTIIIS